MTRIILTRHGETEWNVSGYCQGSWDSPLTTQGLAQAKSLAERLAGEQINAIYASPLGRAKATAQVVAQRFNQEVFPCPEFQEMSFGQWEGKTWDELRNSDPQGFAEWEKTPHSYRIPGGETMEEVLVRAKAKLEELVLKHQGETICIVSHGITVKVLVTHLLGYGLEDWLQTPWQHNTAVNIFTVAEGKYQGLVIGDHSHLENQENR